MSGSPLDEYRRKRDFGRTREPAGDAGTASGPLSWVVQKHRARSLHFDLRLEVGGVMKSWAVPKGPPDGPGERRLAVPTEDHPLEYARFEGVIPEGEYGAGVVMIWDRGTYRNLRAAKEGDGADMERSLDEGKVEIELDGGRLRGRYALIRTRGRGKEQWLWLRKKGDAQSASPGPAASFDTSAVTGRTFDEIAAGEG